MLRLTFIRLTSALVLACLCNPIRSGAADLDWLPEWLGAQGTFVGQRLLPLRSPYRGENSLPPSGDQALSQSYLLGWGTRLGPAVEGYVDLRLARGAGIGAGNGLGG